MSEQPMTPEQLLAAARDLIGPAEVMRILASSFDPMVRRERLAAAIRESDASMSHVENMTRVFAAELAQSPPAMSMTEALADYDRRVGEGDGQ